MGRLMLIGTYTDRFEAKHESGLSYADYSNVDTGESWYVFADNVEAWKDAGLYITTDSDGHVVQNEADASMLAPNGATVWLLKGTFERLNLIEGFEWFVEDYQLVSKPMAVCFNRDAAIANANTMIGLYEDLNDKHAEADWRNYRINAFNWVEGDATPEAPAN